MFGHVTRSSGLAKTILQGTVRRGRKRGRQNRWEDNTTGLGLSDTLRKAESHEEWRELVAKNTCGAPTAHDYGIGKGESYYKSSSVCLFVCLSVCLFVPYLLRGPLTDLRQTWWVYVGGPRNCP